VTAPLVVDLAAIRVQGDAMAPAYRDGDVVIYRRPRDGLAPQPGDDLLVLLSGPAGGRQLVLRRLARWDDEVLELRALNARYPAICGHPRDAVLCGQVIGRLDRTAWR
jgi:phage repressor protein C with HTH and peptisase S24 domain